MKLKKIFLLALLLGGIVSCSWYEIPSSTGPSSSNISYHSFTNSFLDIEKPYLTMEKTSSSTIEDLDVDSLDAVELNMALEEAFELSISV